MYFDNLILKKHIVNKSSFTAIFIDTATFLR